MARPKFTKEQLLAQALRASKPPTPEYEQAVDFGDNEFAIEVAKRLGYRGDIDPKVARLRPTKDDAQLTLSGYYVRPEAKNTKPRRVPGNDRSYDLPSEPDTVNVVGVHAANPAIWSHEYRHRQHPGMSENRNRYNDAFNAQTKADWDSAVEFYQDMLFRQGAKVSLEKAEDELLNYMKLQGNKMAQNENQFYGAEPPPNLPGMFNFMVPDSLLYADDRTKNLYWAKLLRKQQSQQED